MSKIIKLDKILINQISAWEVVERPVSVVKELVENSIDAESTSIKVEINTGWIDEIIISDNWTGIEKEDLIILTEKHTTSKIKNLEDLHKVMTFWFRWEALASISSVSKFKIISKTIESLSWYSLEVLWWEKWEIKEESINIWTKIVVKELFFNTPARINYLKKEKTEYSHISDFLNNIALAHPQIWFEFVNNWKIVFKYKENEDLKTRIYNIFGEEFYNNLLNIDFSFSGLNINWFVSNPKIHFLNKNRQAIFVNGRIISSPLIYRAINEAYRRFIPHNNFPGYILNLQINPEEIDVNVHPRKQEIRFAREQEIYRAFYNAILSKLENSSLVTIDKSGNEWLLNSHPEFISGSMMHWNYTEHSFKDSEINSEWQHSELQKGTIQWRFPTSREWQKSYYTGSGTKFKSYSPYKDVSTNPAQNTIKDSIEFTKHFLSDSTWSDLVVNSDLHYTSLWKIVGQVFNSYIIVEKNDKLVILDQHALAERIIYEKLIKKDLDTQSQQLLIQENLNLTGKEISILAEYRQIFLDMGFDFEILSTSSVLLSAIPNFIRQEDIKNIFLWIISDIWEFNTWKSMNLEEVRNKICAYTACRSAIKFGNKLNLFEMNKLLNDSVLSYSSTCPHWRPSVSELSLQDLKKKYDR